MDKKTLELKGIKSKYFIASFENIKLNYIAIPKNASTSILYALLVKSGRKIGNRDSGYLHSVDVINFITKEEAIKNGYKTFTVLRDPVSRALSSYKDFALNRVTLGAGGGCKGFKEEFRRIRKRGFYNMFKMVQNYSDEDRGNHFKSQSHFCTMENLELHKLETFDFINIPKMNITRDKVELSDKDKQLIYDIYAKDYERFDYFPQT